MSAPRKLILLPILAFCVALRVPAFRASGDPSVGWYLWNFSPLMAVMLFCGANYRHWIWSAAAPLLAYLLGDLAVWLSGGDLAQAFRPDSLWVYLGWLAVLGCGWSLRGRRQSLPVVGAAALGSVASFFLITNFGSWIMDPYAPQPTGYDRSLLGLWQSYVAAIPFSRNDCVATLLFSGLFFSPLGRRFLTTGPATAQGEAVTGPAVAATLTEREATI